jgi:hypothetical protein
VHGFRSSFRDWCADHNISDNLAEAALAHIRGDATSRAYQRGDLLEQRRTLMQRWGEFCAGVQNTDVVQLRRA